MNKKQFTFFFTVVISIIFLLSCGIEDIPYIGNIDQVFYQDINSATVQLPSYSGVNFSYFIIFYRIYIASSDANLSGRIETADQRNLINPALNSDYNSLYSLTDTTNNWVNTSNLENTFFNRRYYKLELEGANINNVLTNVTFNDTLTIEFPGPPGEIPTLSLTGGGTYYLQRANNGPGINFNPLPDTRYFQNHQDLYNNGNAFVSSGTPTYINADAAGNTSVATTRYTYVSMYIAAVGRDILTAVYSQPAFLGIFRLPESF